MTREEAQLLDVDPDFSIYVELGTGEIIGADFIVCAIGVSAYLPMDIVSSVELNYSEDGGLCVDENMRTNVNDYICCW